MSIDVIFMRFEICFEFVELHSTSLHVPLPTMTKMIKLMIIIVIPS
jgi:hypothetical protein